MDYTYTKNVYLATHAQAFKLAYLSHLHSRRPRGPRTSPQFHSNAECQQQMFLHLSLLHGEWLRQLDGTPEDRHLQEKKKHQSFIKAG